MGTIMFLIAFSLYLDNLNYKDKKFWEDNPGEVSPEAKQFLKETNDV